MKMTDEQRKLVEDNHNLIYGFLNKKELEDDEYYDIAAIALCKAAKSYKKSKGVFSTYAYRCINNEMVTYWRYLDKQSNIPEELIMSYDIPVNDNESECYIDRLVTYNSNISDSIIESINFLQFYPLLSDREKTIVEGFKLGFNQSEIAREHNISPQAISDSIKRMKRKWKEFNNR